MAVTTKTFTFDSSIENWAGTPASAAVTMSRITSDGSPGTGCLSARIYGKNQNPGLSRWDWTGTFEDLGVTSGNTVTQIGYGTNNDYNWRCSEYTTAWAGANYIGAFELWVGGSLVGTFKADLSAVSGTTTWATSNGAAITGLNYASNQTITLRISLALRTGNSTSAAVTLLLDQVVLDIEHAVADDLFGASAGVATVSGTLALPPQKEYISGISKGQAFVGVKYEFIPPPAFYRNLEKDADLALADYSGRVKDIQTAMEFVEIGSDATYYHTIVRNFPYIRELCIDATNFGFYNMTVTMYPDNALKKLHHVEYLGTYSGHTNCVKLYYLIAEGQITGTLGDKIGIFNCLPTGIYRNTGIEVPRNTGDWNSTYTCGSCGIWERSAGNYSMLVDGYDSANIPKFRQHEFRATSIDGPWTDQQGATDNLWGGTPYVPTGYIGCWIIVGCNALPDDPTYDYCGATVLVNTSNLTTQPSIAVWSSDMSSRYAFLINHDYTFTIGYTVYNSLKYHKGKWYYSFQDGTFQTGKRVVLVADSIYGKFTYHSTIMNYANYVQNTLDGSMYLGSFANGSLAEIGGKLYFLSSGQSYTPYGNQLVGDYYNHGTFLWVLDESDNTWSLRTCPMMTSPHSNVTGDWGFAWGADHLGYMTTADKPFGTDLWWTITMNDGTDTYQLTTGSFDLKTLLLEGFVGKGRLQGSSNGVATASLFVEATEGAMYGIILGVATASATILAKGKLYGSTSGVSTVSGTLQSAAVIEPISGTIAGISTVSGLLKAKGKLYGAINGVASVSGILKGLGQLYSSISGSSVVSGTMKGLAVLQGATNGVASCSATILAKGKLFGQTTGVASVTGNLISRYILGAVTGSSSLSGILRAKGALVGAIAGTSTVTGSVVLGKILGATSGVSTVSGVLYAKGRLYSTINGLSTVSGTLLADGKLLGVISW